MRHGSGGMTLLLDLLARIGRYGTQGFVASLFVGLSLPWLAAAARPLLGVSVFVFLLTSFMRLNGPAFMAVLRAPRMLILTLACVLIAPGVLVSAAKAVLGPALVDPGLALGLALYAAAPPIMSSPAVAMLLGVEPALILATVLLATVAAPVLSPVIADLVAGGAVPLDLTVLVTRLVGIVGGALVTGLVLRRVLGAPWIGRNARSLDGLGVLMYGLFAIAAMDGVLGALVATPWRVAFYLGLSVALSLAGFAAAWAMLRSVPPAQRVVLGYATGQRNMGLLVAALGASAPETTFLFFALSQFPIYIGPQVMRLLARRVLPQG
jgi:bile acid:Na+ symporter, BASS family